MVYGKLEYPLAASRVGVPYVLRRPATPNVVLPRGAWADVRPATGVGKKEELALGVGSWHPDIKHRKT